MNPRKLAVGLIAVAIGLTGCSHQSDTVSENLSTEADSYKVFRQIVVYNAITDTYILEVDGYCALGNNDSDREVTYTCKSPDGYVKDIIMKSDNTFVFVHQVGAVQVSPDYFKVIVRPKSIIPDLEFQ